MDDAIRELASALAQRQSSPGDDVYVRRGVVTAQAINYTSSAYQVTATIGGKSIANIPCYRGVDPEVGETVDVLFDNGTPIVIGVIRWVGHSVRQLAHAIASPRTNGACLGSWATTVGATQNYLTMTTTEATLYMGLTVVPVRPNRLLRAEFKFAGIDSAAAGKELYIYLKTAWNGGSFSTYSRHSVASTTLEAPHPSGTAIIVTPSNASTVSIELNGQTSTGTIGVYRYGSLDQSNLVLEDIGSAADYLAQGGT